MQHDTSFSRQLHRRPSTGERLRRAIIELAGPHAEIETHKETSWASVTFAGSRHSLTLSFNGPDGLDAGDRFIAALPDHEFTIPRMLVADAAIECVDQRTIPAPKLEVRIELLLLDES